MRDRSPNGLRQLPHMARDFADMIKDRETGRYPDYLADSTCNHEDPHQREAGQSQRRRREGGSGDQSEAQSRVKACGPPLETGTHKEGDSALDPPEYSPPALPF